MNICDFNFNDNTMSWVATASFIDSITVIRPPSIHNYMVGENLLLWVYGVHTHFHHIINHFAILSLFM